MIALESIGRYAPAGLKGRLMRWVIGAVVVVVLAQGARADGFDFLRGSQTVGPALFTRWAGFYGGAQVGYSSANVDFSDATRSLVAYSLRELALESEQHPSWWQVLGKISTDSKAYGGFVGYNTQWQDLVLGIEANYSRTAFASVAPVSPIGRTTTAASNTYGVFITGNASLDMIDYGTLRVRAGWVLGNVLPYAFGGLAVGRSNITRSATVSGTETTGTGIVTPFSFTNSESKDSAFMYGFAVGGGLDVALTPNVYVRAEAEFVQFAPVYDIVVNIMTGRVGAGIKF
jgi:opacity protein-like surface antigen